MVQGKKEDHYSLAHFLHSKKLHRTCTCNPPSAASLQKFPERLFARNGHMPVLKLIFGKGNTGLPSLDWTKHDEWNLGC